MSVKAPEDLSGFQFANDGTNAILTGFSDMKSTEITLPAYVGGAPLRKIGFSAFRGAENLVSVTLPDTVRSIETSAFRECKNLKKITMGKELRFIEEYAFADCRNLKTATFPSTLKKIGVKSFLRCVSFTELFVIDMNKGGDEAKRFVIACQNENRRWGYLNACLIYFDSYSMVKYDEGYGVVHGYDDIYNIAEYRLRNDEQLNAAMRRTYTNNIRMLIPHFIQEDQIDRLMTAGELGLITEERMDSYLQQAIAMHGRCTAYLLDYQKSHFERREKSFEL